MKHGINVLFGVRQILPLRGFPAGKTRIRMRNTEFVQVFVRPPEGGCRRFYAHERDGAWWPAIESGANRNPAPPRYDADGELIVPNYASAARVRNDEAAGRRTEEPIP